MTDGFLGRWARRKQDAREGKPLAQPEAPPAGEPPRRPAVTPAAQTAGPAEARPPQEAPPPSLEDVQNLTPQSDFTPFVARSVAPEVRNAAMKKLFSDPHFNVMDGLDIYIDDYSKSDPIPESMLRQMTSAKFLNLFDDEDKPDTAARADTDGTPLQSVAESPDAPQEPLSLEHNPNPLETGQVAAPVPQHQPVHPLNTQDHAHTDLRLQQDHAAGAEEPRRGAG